MDGNTRFKAGEIIYWALPGEEPTVIRMTGAWQKSGLRGEVTGMDGVVYRRGDLAWCTIAVWEGKTLESGFWGAPGRSVWVTPRDCSRQLPKEWRLTGALGG